MSGGQGPGEQGDEGGLLVSGISLGNVENILELHSGGWLHNFVNMLETSGLNTLKQ